MAKSILLSSMLLFFGGSFWLSLRAQNVPIKRSHILQAGNTSLYSTATIQPQVPDSITIIAVRVAFQADDNRFTSGNGTFENNSLPYLENSEITIDPLPHDRAYFEAHLEFAKNYFTRVSDNQFTLQYRVLPDIYQLDQPMEDYSPIGETFSNEQLAGLARDVWQKVEENGGFDATGLDPDRTAFVIFHAGVGRDIELTGTTLDITPQDIPSLTLDHEALSTLLGEADFAGFPINDGTFRITNSIILPRTLSRRGEDFTGNEFVLQLSINGLICASIGSYLGLPDLFDTSTGNSAIGRFGLMDGEGFFSYRGLFPPEPSAWEKMWLGWQTPFQIDRGSESEVTLPAASLQDPSSIARYNLSRKEYFLVENRHRDPQNDGATLTIRRPDGTLAKQTFDNTDQAFVNQEAGFEELLEPGVVVDIDDFDWSLPGGLDPGMDGNMGTGDDLLLNGGILIWHIDENIIRNQLGSQSVNANPDRRGVDLEEADGAQDIGRAANETFSTQARGWAFDFWWSGNDARVITLQDDTLSLYQNRFAPDTRPPNHSNSGAQSYFEFYNFSDNLPVASFRVRPLSGTMTEPVQLTEEPVPGENTFILSEDSFRNHYPPSLSLYTAQSDSFLIIPTQTSVFALQLHSGSNFDYFDFNQPTPQHPYVGEQLILSTAPGNMEEAISVNAWFWNGTGWLSNWETTTSANLGFLSSTNDDTLHIDFSPARLLTENGEALPDLSIPQQRSAPQSGQTAILEPGNIRLSSNDFFETVNTDLPRIYTGSFRLEPGRVGFFLLSNNSLKIIDPDASQPIQTVAESSFINWPALADFDDDRRIDILYVDGERGALFGRHPSGAMMTYFPIMPPDGSRFVGTPLVADLDGNGEQEVIITVQDSVSMAIHAYNRQGEPVNGFPLLAGGVEAADLLPINPIIREQTLYAVSHDGDLKAWKFPNMGNVRWSTVYGNHSYNKVTGRIAGTEPPSAPTEILVSEETYNWPNPASDRTHIRYRLRESGTVEIKIITPGGRVVYTNKFEVAGGSPEEQQINTSGWSNGIYLAMVTAKIGGREERKMIKIAVVH